MSPPAAIVSPMPTAPVGEVIEATTTEVVAQACNLESPPPLGTFVIVADDRGCEVMGVVAHVETGGLDSASRPIMRGRDGVRDRQIYEENPDLLFVLRTTFRALVVGHNAGEGWKQILPPLPPRLHYSVRIATSDEARAFTEVGFAYLGSLLSATDIPSDEVVAANVRLAGEQRGEPYAFALQAGRELAQCLRADYARLSALLRRMALAAPTGAAR
ncbi:MAG: hypothetical protein HYX52_00445 [Chloroflexi bacterium]|nr:hypothetical protein [Chloroflexota bacterium]